MSLGEFLSAIVGGNTSLTERKGIYKSPTTNSYQKCLEPMYKHFTHTQMAAVEKAVNQYDRTSFTERVAVDGKVIVVHGLYKNTLFAHLKTIEMYIDDSAKGYKQMLCTRCGRNNHVVADCYAKTHFNGTLIEQISHKK